MILVFLIGFSLVAVTVAIHAAGLALLVRFLQREFRIPRGRWPLTWFFIRFVWLVLLIHGIGISVWAMAFWLTGGLPDINTAFYFSGATYTTIGYGDYVLAPPWRMLGPLEGVTGILMCALSGAVFVAVVTRTLDHKAE